MNSLPKIGQLALREDNLYFCILSNDPRLMPLVLAAERLQLHGSIVDALEQAIRHQQHENIKVLIEHLPDCSMLDPEVHDSYFQLPFCLARAMPNSTHLARLCQIINPIECLIHFNYENLNYEGVLKSPQLLEHMVPAFEQLWLIASDAQKELFPKECNKLATFWANPEILMYAPILKAFADQKELKQHMPQKPIKSAKKL